VEQIVE
jgi:hypothetical protein